MIRVMKFGIHSILENVEAASAEMGAAHRYYNALLEIRRREWRAFREIRAKHVPEIGAVEVELAELNAQIEAVYDDIKSSRQRATVESGRASKIAASAEQLARLDDLKAQRKDAYARRKALLPRFTALMKPAWDAYQARTSGAPAELLAQIQEIGAQLKEAKKTRKNPDVPAIAQALAELKKRKKSFDEATHKKRAVNLRVREEMFSESEWYEAWKEFERVRHEIHEAALALRKGCGLAPGTYLAVEEAVAAAIDDADDEPHFKPWNGGRKIGVQLKGMTGAKFYAGGDNSLRLVSISDSRSKGRSRSSQYAVVAIPVSKGKERTHVSCSVRLHRPIPKDAEIRWAYIVPRRVGFRTKYELQLTVSIDATLAARERGYGEALVKLGWSLDKETGCIIAATVGSEQIRVHERTLSAMRFARSLRETADRHFNFAVDELRAWVKANECAPQLREAVADSHAWRRHSRLAVVARDWVAPLGERVIELWRLWIAHRDSTGSDYYEPKRDVFCEWLASQGVTSGAEQMGLWLEWWRRKDAHLIQWAADVDAKARRRRKNDYRITAARLAERFERVAVLDLDLARAAQRKTPDRDADDLHQMARYLRTCAAPYELQECLLAAFGKERYRVVKRERSGDADPPVGARDAAVDADISGEAAE